MLDGEDISTLGPRQRWQRGVGRGFQVAATFRSLSVRDNAKAALLASRGASWKLLTPASRVLNEPASDLLRRVGLFEDQDRPSDTLAYGDLRRLELALAIANTPRLLLLDEPTAGTSSDDRWILMEMLRKYVAETDTAVLLTEHDVDVVFKVADRILVLDKGRLIANGNPAAVRLDPMVRAAYLGDVA